MNSETQSSVRLNRLAPDWEKFVAAGVSLIALLPMPGLTVFTGSLASLVLLSPLLYSAIHHNRNLSRLATCLVVLALLAPIAAAVVSGSSSGLPSSDWYLRPVSLVVSVASLYWSATKIGLGRAVCLAIPAPLIFDILTRSAQGNTWKYAASVWITVGLLVLVHRMSFVLKLTAVGIIVVLSILNDTRGIIAMVGIGILVEFLSRTGRAKLYRFSVSLVGAGILAVATYQLAIAGALGRGIQMTMALQTQHGPMSLFRTARPESGGNLALVLSDPFRFVIDDRLTSDQAAVIRDSFTQVGRDPGSQYVQKGVLNNSELHSITADLWLHTGFTGLLIAAIFLVFFVYLGVRALTSGGSLTALTLFVSLRGIWDLLFSPISDMRFWPLYVIVGFTFLASKGEFVANTR